MIICEKCFASEQIQQGIRRVGFVRDCPTCGNTNCYTINTNHIAEELPEVVDWFDDLLSHFTCDKTEISDIPDEEYVLLCAELRKNWNIFSKNIQDEQAHEIISAICSDLYRYDKDLFEKPVIFKEKYDRKELELSSLTRNKTWDDFVKEISSENRFHTKTINLEALERILSFIQTVVPAGQKFYRCRINHGETKYRPKEMWAPPPGRATSGRANAPGISCLYLAKDPETAIAEVRAGAYDQVTVGTFRLMRDIPVIDFRLIKTLCPIGINMKYVDYAINHEHLVKIDQEMAKGLKSGDHSVDYVATQYITDFIKSRTTVNKNGEQEKQYWGIIYNSTLHEEGYNLAVFYQDVFKCIETKAYQVKTVQYSTDIML